jgi:two-component system sensor histidine kinase/response regulator
VSRKLNILVAEDNPVNQLMARAVLERLGHSVVVVNNGEEALRALTESSYDLTLMDVQMPGMDGLEATALLREQEKLSGKHLTVIAMTAMTGSDDRELCTAAGMDDYLSKPIRAKELDAMVGKFLAGGAVS